MKEILKLNGQEITYLKNLIRNCRERSGCFIPQRRCNPCHAFIYNMLVKLRSLEYDINYRDIYKKHTILISLSSHNWPELIKFLLEKGANPNITNEYKETALINAAYHGNKDVVKMLLDYDANIDHRDEKGRTALIYASKRGYNEVVDILLNRGANIYTLDNCYRTSLIEAMIGNSEMIVKRLLELNKKLDPNNENKYLDKIVGDYSAFTYACQKRNLMNVKRLIEYGCNIKNPKIGTMGLIIALYNYNVSIVDLLIEKNVPLDEMISNHTPLMVAAMGSRRIITKILIDKGVNIHKYNKDGENALSYLMATRYYEYESHKENKYKIAKMLIKRGIDINKKYSYSKITPLMGAIKRGYDKIVELLINHKNCLINDKDREKHSAIIYACRSLKRMKYLKLLIKRGYDHNIIYKYTDNLFPSLDQQQIQQFWKYVIKYNKLMNQCRIVIQKNIKTYTKKQLMSLNKDIREFLQVHLLKKLI